MRRPLRVAGAVLAGGRSARMGSTKAVIESGGREMGNRVIDALRAAGCDPVVVYGGDPEELAVLDAPVWPDRYPGEGPVGGVLGLLTRFWSGPSTSPTSDDLDAVLIVACDLPDLDDAVTMPVLAGLANDGERADVAVARTDRIEPMCGVWRPSAIPALREAFEGGTRALHRALERLNVVEVEVPAAGLRNVNTVADLDQADLL